MNRQWNWRSISARRTFTTLGAVLLALVGGALVQAPSTAVPDTLANPLYPYPTNAHLEPTSLAIAHAEATKRTEEVTRIARGEIASPTPTRLPPVIHPLNVTGVIQGTLPPPDDFPFRHDAIIENFWRQFPNSIMFVIAAGATMDDPQQGFVGVATSMKTGLVAFNKSLTPTKHGSVRITAVNGVLVTLMARDGTIFTFDYCTYTFK